MNNEPSIKEQLEQALRDRDAAKEKITAILSSHHYKNKTVAMRLILGSCPECGCRKENPPEYYCNSCRISLSRHALNRLHNSEEIPFATQSLEHPYNNDNH